MLGYGINYMIEYWLQKKTIGGWSQVTNYQDLDQAKRNFVSCVGKGNSGYCWRLAEVKIIEEAMLDEVTIIETDKDVELPQAKVGQSVVIRNIGDKPIAVRPWGNPVQDKPKSSGWGQTAPWGQNQMPISLTQAEGLSSDQVHGFSGSVWVIHHGQKHKARIAGNELELYLAKGYERGGPRTQFRE